MDKRKQLIEVIPYDREWPKLFKLEVEKLQPIFGSNFVAVHHIGSTSVPGLTAKPTIDMVLEVDNIEAVDACNEQMLELGYEAWGEYKIPGRRFFVKGEDKRTHHVHIFIAGSFDVLRHLYLRDYLIAHPAEAKRYADLKIELANKYFNNRRAYVENKSNYVKNLEQKAIAWASTLR